MKRLRILRFLLCSILLTALFMPGAVSVLGQNECNSLGAPVVQTGSIAAADTDQTLRLFRDGRGGTCEFLRPPTTSAGTYDADSYTYTNTSGGPICVFVDLDAVGCGVATNQLSISAYLGTYNPASILTNIIGDPGLSTGQNFVTSMNFVVPAGQNYVVVVHNINAGTTCASYTIRKYETNNCRDPGFDLLNDGWADIALFRPSGGLATWHTLAVSGSGTSVFQLGSAGDIPVDGDYTGDETSDVAVFRPSNGTWYRSTNPGTNYDSALWGASGDIPVEGDYDRDGITDLAVYRPSTQRWFVLRSSTSSYMEFPLGIAGDKPVPADYDGDGKLDPGVMRPGSTNQWITLPSSGNYVSFNQNAWGISTDIPVPADYDGDAKADIAVFRPSDGNWYIFRTSVLPAVAPIVVHFGASGDIPQPADFDGDRRADQAVFRPSDNSWWINRSLLGIYATTFGQAGDIPTTAPNPHLP